MRSKFEHVWRGRLSEGQGDLCMARVGQGRGAGDVPVW